MNASSCPPRPQRPWGYERPDCRGANALGLFIDDLHRVLDEHTAGREASPLAVMAAQQGVDRLLAHYVRKGAQPSAFNGQSVTLRHAMDKQGVHHVVPIFSPVLKGALTALLPSR
ncbi:hypothetical protein V8Z80_17705 [Orrella sp. JC864]|uniref:hypothetical protein n=1 Tax=Orrella sp. JC864 TaxID=3120298 RepID=UPI0012BCA157